MALTITQQNKSIWKITGTTSSSTKITDEKVHLQWVHWHKPTTVGHLLSVTDKDGNQLTNGYCLTGNESQWLPVDADVNGIYIDDLDSGTVLIGVRKGGK